MNGFPWTSTRNNLILFKVGKTPKLHLKPTEKHLKALRKKEFAIKSEKKLKILKKKKNKNVRTFSTIFLFDKIDEMPFEYNKNF